MIEITAEHVDRINAILAGVPGGAEKALTAVINRARSTVRAEALKGITSVYDIKPADVRDRKNTTINLRTRKVNGSIIGEVRFSGGKIPLYRFGATPREPTKMGAKVPVKIGDRWLMIAPGAPVKAGQLKGKAKETFHNAFIAEMSTGHTGMFERSGFERMPIIEFMGSSTAEMARNSVVLERVEAAAMDTINKRVEHEITRILNGYT